MQKFPKVGPRYWPCLIVSNGDILIIPFLVDHPKKMYLSIASAIFPTKLLNFLGAKLPAALSFFIHGWFVFPPGVEKSPHLRRHLLPLPLRSLHVQLAGRRIQALRSSFFITSVFGRFFLGGNEKNPSVKVQRSTRSTVFFN